MITMHVQTYGRSAAWYVKMAISHFLEPILPFQEPTGGFPLLRPVGS